MFRNRILEISTLAFLLSLPATTAAQVSGTLVTNDDNPIGNTATFYSINAGGLLTQTAVVSTGGQGFGGGYFASPRISVMRGGQGCTYVSNNDSRTISSIVEATHTLAGIFEGSSEDVPQQEIGLALSGRALYAGYGESQTIATFALESGCTLRFLGDVSVHGPVDGMKVHGSLLVVADGDGHIESFDISDVMPISNGDLQLSTAFTMYGDPASGVDISKDGQWAIFGDASRGDSVEVSDISSGKLGPTVVYRLSSGVNSNSVLLSPDQKFLLIANNDSGTVSAAFFDSGTGAITNGCTSKSIAPFRGLSGIATAPSPSGSGFVYVAGETSGVSAIGILRLMTDGVGCKLPTVTGSPASDPQSPTLRSIATYAGS
jgi:WD40 repeat protein